MPIDFPSSPTTGQVYTYGGVTYIYSAQGVWTTAAAGGGGGSGNVSNSGTPAAGEIAEWVTATTIKGTAKASLGFALSTDFPAGAWTAWTPTITSGVGAITSTTITTARYQKAGTTVTAYFDIMITNAGTGAGFLQISIPVTCAASGGGFCTAREVAVVGYTIAGAVDPTGVAILSRYDGVSVVVTNYRIKGVMIYESS